jgi:hypothetical protein
MGDHNKGDNDDNRVFNHSLSPTLILVLNPKGVFPPTHNRAYGTASRS